MHGSRDQTPRTRQMHFTLKGDSKAVPVPTTRCKDGLSLCACVSCCVQVTPGPTLRPPGIPRSKSHTPSWRPTAAWDSSPASHLSASPHTPHDPAALLDPYHHTTHHEDPSNPYTDQQSTYRPAQGPASHSTHSTGQGAAGHSTRLVLPGDEGGVGGYEGPRSGSRGVTRGVGSGDRLAGGAQGLPAGAMGAGLAASPGGPPAPSAASG